MTGPEPCVAAVRVAVRRALADLDPGAPVGVALSGGADSLALLAATTFERAGVTALVVDQGWYDGSAAVAQRAADQARALGADAAVLAGPASRDEAAARDARYEALDRAAADRGLAAVLLGHTRDDQAETVLLALARGSGARSLAGMAPVRGVYRRPLLGLGRQTTRAACVAQGLAPYDDPANADPTFARVRVRALLAGTHTDPDGSTDTGPQAGTDAGPQAGTDAGLLADALGHDVTANLATTARLLRDDADLLDALADAARTDEVETLAALPAALRRRVLHGLAPGLTVVHVDALDALVLDWHGQGPVALPGGTAAVRRSGRITVVPGSRS